MKLGSLFDGSGGFPLAGTLCGIEPVVCLQGQNAQYDFEITDSGVNSTIVAKGPSAVSYAMQGIAETLERRVSICQ